MSPRVFENLKEIQNEMEQRRENIYFNENIDYIGE
jgi:hypothetical protein